MCKLKNKSLICLTLVQYISIVNLRMRSVIKKKVFMTKIG